MGSRPGALRPFGRYEIIAESGAGHIKSAYSYHFHLPMSPLRESAAKFASHLGGFYVADCAVSCRRRIGVISDGTTTLLGQFGKDTVLLFVCAVTCDYCSPEVALYAVVGD